MTETSNMGHDVESVAREIFAAFDLDYDLNSASVREKVHKILAGRICGVPDGFVMVPREPTIKIIEAMHDEYLEQNKDVSMQVFWEERIYKAIIVATSTPGGGDD
jgi:hypothetical protein